jgi:tetratricopeptide (TPR) repeat protein
MLLDDNPAEALELYRKALAISSELSSTDAANIYYRSAVADALLGIGQALYNLGKREEALHNLARVVELQKSIEAVAPDRIWLLRTTSRVYMVTGNVLFGRGDAAGALDNYLEGLAAAERSFQRASSSLHHALDRADLLEAMGRYYLTLAARPGIGRARRAELKAEARSCLEKELAIWRDWKERKAAVPYAARRESQAATYMALCNQP